MLQKSKCVSFYSKGKNRCACCGESHIKFLTIDHKNNNGNEHRKQIGRGGMILLRWIIKNGYPSGFQILCYNCNYAKNTNEGVCPHLEK